MSTSDQVVYENAITASGSSDRSPFIKRELLSINDNNASGNYSSNQVIFDATILANNGKHMNWAEAKIVVPFVIQVNGKAAAVDFTGADATISDYMLALKNCNTSLLHSYSIDFGNSQIVGGTTNINMYHAFKYHTELTDEEARLFGSEIGYAKDTPDSWFYRKEASLQGTGLINNCNGYDSFKTGGAAADNSGMNQGMMKRQENWIKRVGPVGADAAAGNDGKELVWGADVNTHFRNEAISYVQNTAMAKYYHINAVIRLKDLLFFNSPDFPALMRNSYFKLTLTFNQVFFEFNKANTTGLLTFDRSSLQLTSGGCNPILIAASYNQNKMARGNATSDAVSLLAARPCGSACLPLNTTYQVSLSIVNTKFTHAFGPAQSTAISQCRLYVPAYTLDPLNEQALISLGQKTIKYTDVIPFTIYNQSSTFSSIITAAVGKAKRMIIVPVMAENANFSEVAPYADIQSPFSTSPSTTAPLLLNKLQVMVGGVAIYNQPIDYNYESFIQEIGSLGQYGNMIKNYCSGQISYRDYISGMYNYIVVDLRRRSVTDENLLQSISISGTIVSLKAVNLYVFIEVEREVIVDMATGLRIL